MSPAPSTLGRLGIAACSAVGASLIAAGCGSDDTESTTAANGSSAQLSAVKDYLTAHADSLQANVDVARAGRGGLLRPRRGGRLRLRAADG